MFQEVSDELLVKIGEPEEGLHLLFVCQSGPLSDTSNLDWVHCDGVVRDNHPKVLNHGFLELALVRMKLVLLQKFQNAVGDLSVLFKGLHEDENIVQIEPCLLR